MLPLASARMTTGNGRGRWTSKDGATLLVLFNVLVLLVSSLMNNGASRDGTEQNLDWRLT
jgi:hypothetical protein